MPTACGDCFISRNDEFEKVLMTISRLCSARITASKIGKCAFTLNSCLSLWSNPTKVAFLPYCLMFSYKIRVKLVSCFLSVSHLFCLRIRCISFFQNCFKTEIMRDSLTKSPNLIMLKKGLRYFRSKTKLVLYSLINV